MSDLPAASSFAARFGAHLSLQKLHASLVSVTRPFYCTLATCPPPSSQHRQRRAGRGAPSRPSARPHREVSELESPPANATLGVLHVHVSGSAGTTMCVLARTQAAPLASRAIAGNAYNCLMPCMGPTHWKRYLYDVHASGTAEAACGRTAEQLYASCASLEGAMWRQGYGVLGEMESVLPELSGPADFGASLREAYRKVGRLCPDALPERRWNASAGGGHDGGGGNRQASTGAACFSSSESIFGAWALPRPANHSITAPPRRQSALLVRRGASSLFDLAWPPSGFRPLATLCARVRYTFLMHEPLSRLATQLLMRCPPSARSNRSCADWAIGRLAFVYEHDLVLDDADEIGFMGTPSASNYNTRLLLGPRVFFARLGALTDAHHEASKALLSRFTLVMPLSALSNATGLEKMARALNWSVTRMPHANRHVWTSMSSAKAAVLSRARELLQTHNAWDVQLYEWVTRRFWE